MFIKEIGVTTFNFQDEKRFLQDREKNISSLNLYATLDEQNRIIATLKQRILNQQIQLAYYLHKNLCQDRIIEFSRTCAHDTSGDSVTISVSMYKLMQESADSENLNKLHSKLAEYDVRVTSILKRQEKLMKKASESVAEDDYCNYVQNHIDDNDFSFSDRTFHVSNLDMYSKIMNATMQVKKELQQLRKYAVEIIQVESERNALIDYIFTLPKDQRDAGLNLLENIKSDNISDHAACESDHVQQILSNGDVEKLGSESENKKYIGFQLNEVLVSVEQDTSSIVSLTEKQAEVFEDEIERLTNENLKLADQIQNSDRSIQNGQEIQSLQEKCSAIEKDLEEVKRGLEEEVEKKESEVIQLRDELYEVSNQAIKLEDEVLDLKSRIESFTAENEILKETLDRAKIYNIVEEKKRMDLQNKVIDNQKDQIKNLMLIICRLNDSFNEKSSNDPSRKYEDADIIINEEMKDSDAGSRSDNGYFTAELSERTGGYHHNQERNNSHAVSGATSAENQEEISAENVEKNQDYENNISREPHEVFTCNSIPKAVDSCVPTDTSCSKSQMTTTSLKIESRNAEGKKESMKAILESSQHVEGIVEMQTASKLRLRLHCGPSNSNGLDNTKSAVSTTNSVSSAKKSKLDIVETKVDFVEPALSISKQILTIKNELNDTLRQPNGRKNIIKNIHRMYSQVFGNNTENV